MINSHFQRLGVFSIIFLFFTPEFGWAQTEKFMTEMSKTILTASKLSDQADNDALIKLDKHPNAKDIHYFKMGNLENVQKNGLFDFNSPLTGKIIHAMVSRIESNPNGDYFWYGTVSDTVLKGEMILHSLSGKISGYLNYSDESYQIYGIGKNNCAFVPYFKGKTKISDCVSNSDTKKILNTDSNQTAPRSVDGTCSNPTRILYLYTDNEASLDPNPQQTAQTAFDQFQQALNNSQVNVPTLTFAGAASISSFVEKQIPPHGINPITDDLNSLINNVGNQAHILRDLYKADIVVVMTNGSYPEGYLGTAYVDVENARAYCIVEYPSIIDNYTACHEISHLYGNRHQDEFQNLPETAYAHGYKFYHIPFPFVTRFYETITATIDGDGQFPNHSRILYYSNPNVYYDNESIGTAADHDESRKIRENSLKFASYQPGTSAMTATVSGPYSISSSSCNNFYNTDITCGSLPYSYQWAFSSNGFTYYNGSTSSTGSVCVYPYSSYASSGKVYARLQVTSSSGEVVYAFFTSNVTNIPHYIRQNDTNGNNLLVQKINILNDPYPNPVSNDASISFNLVEKQSINLELLNEFGSSVQTIISGEFESGEYQTNISTKTLAPGLYFVRLSNGTNQTIKKLLYSK